MNAYGITFYLTIVDYAWHELGLPMLTTSCIECFSSTLLRPEWATRPSRTMSCVTCKHRLPSLSLGIIAMVRLLFRLDPIVRLCRLLHGVFPSALAHKRHFIST